MFVRTDSRGRLSLQFVRGKGEVCVSIRGESYFLERMGKGPAACGSIVPSVRKLKSLLPKQKWGAETEKFYQTQKLTLREVF